MSRRPGSGLPRSAWLAVGAIVAALVGPLAGPPALVVGAAAIAVVGLGLTRLDAGRAHAVALGGLALGTMAIAARLWLAGPPPPPPPLPSGSGPWTAMVVAVGTPRDGSQVATVELVIRERPIRLAATLPRYPDVVPGDTVLVGGSIRPPPDDDYGTYLRRTGAAGHASSADPGTDRRGDRLVGRRAPARGWRRPGVRHPRTRGRSRRGDPHRSPGTRGSGPRGGLRDGRRESRRGDQRLEHRARRGDRGGHAAGTREPVAAAVDRGRDRRLHRSPRARRRRCFARR